MKTLRTFFLVLACLQLTGAALAAPAKEEQKSFQGRWEGAILFEEGRLELAMEARFLRTEDGGWSAILDFPLVGVLGLEVGKTRVVGDHVTLVFDLDDGSGERSISAWLNSSGKTIEGELIQGRTVSPVYLDRRGEPAEEVFPVRVTSLDAPGLTQLRQRFNADLGTVRLLMLLAPS